MPSPASRLMNRTQNVASHMDCESLAIPASTTKLISICRWGLTGPIRYIIFGSLVFATGCHAPQGEIDILEGVNNMTPNTATLHTGSSNKFSSHTLLSFNPPVRLSHVVVTRYDWVRANDIYPLICSSQSSSRSIGQNCAAYETENAGCGVQFSDPASFGVPFNNNQGGWYD